MRRVHLVAKQNSCVPMRRAILVEIAEALHAKIFTDFRKHRCEGFAAAGVSDPRERFHASRTQSRTWSGDTDALVTLLHLEALVHRSVE